MGQQKRIYTDLREYEAEQERLNKREEEYWNSQPASKKPTVHKDKTSRKAK